MARIHFKLKLKHLLCVFAFSASLLLPARAGFAGIGDEFNLSPFWHWKVIETEHFRITFPEKLFPTVERAANYLEQAHSVLSKKLYWEASYKVPILMVDNVDSANGVTSPIERFGIILYLTPPDDWFSTAYYDDWLRLLCFHEYTHFLNIDATRGIWTLGRVLFGDVFLPNGAWPSWMLEGLAVYMETRFTHSGRGRSTYYETILRSAVEAGVLDTSRFFTLDRVNGANIPYFPEGESVYMFGYKLMNEVAQSNQAGPTYDGGGKLSSGEDALGIMSYRSSWRIPWFINGNLENITGRDWYQYWDKLVAKSRERTSKELDLIRSQPVSQLHPMTTDGLNITGSAFSPDGKWAAYTEETLDQRNGLVLRNLQTGEVNRVANKLGGAQLAFTPDSKRVVLSSLRRADQYHLYSEIGAYSLETKTIQWLTTRKRARDPDVSKDGKFVVFTSTQDAKTSLSIGTLVENAKNDDKLELRDVHEIVPVKDYDVASSPKFSLDGRVVYFTLHRNGAFAEDLMAVELATGTVRTLLSNGHFNRYPTIGPKGEVYFVSDLSGVDNLYRYHEGSPPELYTNLTTGMAFPSVAPGGEIYGTVLSYTGWNIDRIDPLPTRISASSVTIAPAPAPQSDADSDARPATAQYFAEDYSIFPSIWPRGWIPYAYIAPSNVLFGEDIIGFDATDRHRYFADIGYDSLSSSLDWTGVYQNRQLGPTVTLLGGNQFSYAIYSGDSVLYYARDQVYSLGVSFRNFWTYSSLTPSLALTADNTSYYLPSASGPFLRTGFLPELDLLLSYSNATRSRLAISAEGGRDFLIGASYFASNGNQSNGAVKGLFADTEYIRVGKSHAVFSPSIKAAYTSSTPSSNTNLNSDVVLQGYYPLFYTSPILLGVDGFPFTSLSRLPLRGYPFAVFFEKAAMIPALDFNFPIADVFRGWGTNPLFLSQIYGTVFAQAAYLPDHEAQIFPLLASAGGGLTANLEFLLQVPISVSVQYQYGFQQAAFGMGDLIVDVGYSGALF